MMIVQGGMVGPIVERFGERPTARLGFALMAVAFLGIAYSSASMAGLVTAVEAGLAVTILPRSALPREFRELAPDEGFPVLPPVDIGLIPPRGDAGSAAHALADHIAQSSVGADS